MVKDLRYYEGKLDIIIYLLNSTNDVKVLDYLTDEYAKNYIEYERLYNEQEREKKNITFHNGLDIDYFVIITDYQKGIYKH